MNVVSVVGARPQFIKLKPIDDALTNQGIPHSVIHTGQHYDSNMSEIFFRGLNLPNPKYNLEIGSGSHGAMTGKMLSALEELFIEEPPDFVVVYGDTNSTMAAALAAAKLEIPVGHVEAGLRSHNLSMPEELNRKVTDHVSNLLFAPTDLAMVNLKKEGLSEHAFQTGDVMADLIYTIKPSIEKQDANVPTFIEGTYVVATIHRASNTDSIDQLCNFINSLIKLNEQVILVAHPRLTNAIKRFGLEQKAKELTIIEPIAYVEMMSLLLNSVGLITDSGGLQKEAFLLGVPCITLRTETEWPETLENSMNVLSPNGSNLQELLQREVGKLDTEAYGNGLASSKIVKLITDYFQ